MYIELNINYIENKYKYKYSNNKFSYRYIKLSIIYII